MMSIMLIASRIKHKRPTQKGNTCTVRMMDHWLNRSLFIVWWVKSHGNGFYFAGLSKPNVFNPCLFRSNSDAAHLGQMVSVYFMCSLALHWLFDLKNRQTEKLMNRTNGIHKMSLFGKSCARLVLPLPFLSFAICSCLHWES